MKQPCKKHKKRGSMLIVALFLLIFILVMGGALVMWGMSNVQTSVNSRDVTQAYYSAKSLTDTLVQELMNLTDQGMQLDGEIRALKPKGKVFTATYDASPIGSDTLTVGALPAEKATLVIKCTADDGGKRDEAGRMIDGVQQITIATTCTYAGFTRTVTRAMSAEHRPPANGVAGLTIGLNGKASNENCNLYSYDIFGDVMIDNAKNVRIADSNITGDVKISASYQVRFMTLLTSKAYFHDKTKTVNLYAPNRVFIAGHMKADGAMNLYTPKVYDNNMDKTAVYTKLDYPSKPPKFETYTLVAPAEPGKKIPAIADLSERIWTQSVTATKGGTVNNLIVETQGRDIAIIAPDITFTGTLTCTGGGSVTFYANNAMVLSEITLTRGANTRVSFVSVHGDITVNINPPQQGGYEHKANFLCPEGNLNINSDQKGYALHGTIWCKNLVKAVEYNRFKLNTTPTPTDWWGDTAGLTKTVDSSGSGGANGLIEYKAKKYQ
ncbi:MAG: hypothetical protein RR859_07480 [Ruthenibacterium sp.]